MIALTIVGIIGLCVALLLLIRTGRIIANQNDHLDALINMHNVQIRKHHAIEERIEHTLDCLLTLDVQTAAATGLDATD